MTENALHELVIRRMTVSDLPQVSEIDVLSFSLPWPASSFKYELERNSASRCWVVEGQVDAGSRRIAAMAVVWFIIDEVHIATIAVHPDFRQMKIGQQLLAHVIDSAAGEGALHAFLEVRERNQAARKMYQKFGFVEVGVRPRYYSDTGEDAILMNLDGIHPGMFESFE